MSKEVSIPSKPEQIVTVTLQDGSHMDVEVHGEGMALLLPVNPAVIEGSEAEQLRQYGADPALGQSLIRGLRDMVRVVAFDYEGHLWKWPRPRSLTPENVVKDLLAIADAARAERFIYYGYSWLGMIGLQLALRTDRLAGLVMGGFPPLDGPYKEMLQVTTAAYNMAGGDPAFEGAEDDAWSTARLSKDQTQQYMTLYQALQEFDDEAAQANLTCPRLCFAGAADEMQYGKNWGNVLVSLAGPLLQRRAELEASGWEVRILEGLDHMQAMQAERVVPLMRLWVGEIG